MKMPLFKSQNLHNWNLKVKIETHIRTYKIHQIDMNLKNKRRN